MLRGAASEPARRDDRWQLLDEKLFLSRGSAPPEAARKHGGMRPQYDAFPLRDVGAQAVAARVAEVNRTDIARQAFRQLPFGSPA